MTHIPTGLVVSQQDEKSQIKNRAKALKVLRSRLYEIEMRKQQDAIAKERRGQVGTGERSEKIRTYNFPQSRITDHRINFTTHQLHGVLDGNLAELVDALTTFYTAQLLKEATEVGPQPPVEPQHSAALSSVTFHELAASARATLERAGIAGDVAQLDAELLARHVAGLGPRDVARPSRRHRDAGLRSSTTQPAHRAPRSARAGRVHPRHAGVLGPRVSRHAGGADSDARKRSC